jgi:hypothetical protein
MKRSNKSSEVKKFKLTKNIVIGSPDAETDRILMNVFVKSHELDSLLDVKNHKSIIIGRTGSGKSALISYLERTQERVCRIEPEAMSLRYLSNSTILGYFRELGINLNFFYKVLWKHVLIVELLKLYFGEDTFRKQNWIENFKQKIFSSTKRNPRKERAIDYLTKWSNDFWLDTEMRIKEIEHTLESKFLIETGRKFADLLGGGSAENSDKEKRLTEYRNKAERIINETQADEIFEILNIMRSDIFIDFTRKYFIVIDDLDKEWIPTDIRYDLINALIEVIKEFQVFQGTKIVIALRDNLHKIIFSGLKHTGGQREKYKPLYLHLDWTRDDLEQLLSKRLELITDNNLNIKNAFERQYNSNKTGFDYMLERTFMRPRDVISFVNHTIENATNKSFFSLELIKKAELYYSNDRLQAIEDEWAENYGDLRDLYSFLIGKYNGFRLKNIKEEEFINLLLGENPELKYKGDLLDIILKYKNNIKFSVLIKDIIYILYQIGILGIKKGPTYPICFYYDKEIQLTINDLNNDCKIYVHKAFNAALKINTKEMEADVY